MDFSYLSVWGIPLRLQMCEAFLTLSENKILYIENVVILYKIVCGIIEFYCR
jgi:hypothetical protein